MPKESEEKHQSQIVEVKEEPVKEPAKVPANAQVIFSPNPGPQTDFLAAAEQEVLYGGAAGGGKSFALVVDPMRYFGNKYFQGLVLRRSTEELRELINISKLLFPQFDQKANWTERDKTWRFSSGASFWMSYLERDDDVLRYQGQAFSWIGFDELTQWPTPYPWDYMRSRLRTSKDSGLPLFMRATSNPGGPGHCVPFGEVLTKDGWVDIRAVKAGDIVISVDALGQQVYKEVSDVVEEDYDGIMVNRKDEMVFTENHRLPMKTETGFDIRPFYRLPGQCSILRSAYTLPYSEQGDYFTVPAYKTRKLRLPQPDKILWSDYCELMGWFLSEGHTLDRDKEFGIAQVKEPQRERIRRLLKKCGFKFRESSTGFQVSSPKWWSYFRQFGKCRDKFIPRDVMDSLFLRHFFEALMAGDGHWDSKTSGTYYTISEQLANDVMEVCVRLGYSTRLYTRQRDQREGPSYEIRFSKRSVTELNTGNHLYSVETISNRVNCDRSHYKGKVYCITVPETETFFIRQNGYVWVSGNTWVKKTFIDPATPGKAFWARDMEGQVMVWPSNSNFAKENGLVGQPMFKRRFIPATLFDNPYLAEDGNYEANLLSLPEHQRKQLLEGSWDIMEGAAFSEFSRQLHVVEPFDIPKNWIRFRACDYGYGSFAGVIWFAVDPATNQLIIYRELKTKKVLAVDLADMILELEAGEKIRYGVLDSSLWHNRGDTGPSLAEQMILRGCRWRPSDRSRGSRVSSKNEVHRRLQVDPYTEQPRLVIFSNCVNLISELPTLPLDKKNPEDVDTTVDDHMYDALRYGVMSRPTGNYGDFDGFAAPTYQPVDNVFGY